MASQVRNKLESLNLSARQIKSMTRNSGAEWPDELVNDYLTILRNFIDVSTVTDSNADQVELNKNEIKTNTDNISTNATNISTNATNISTNTTNIGENTQDILNLEFRSLGRPRPLPYNEVITTYNIGDYVVNPSTDLQSYYKAKVKILAPAGPFDKSKWQVVSIENNESRFFSNLGTFEPEPYKETGASYGTGSYVLEESTGLYFKSIGLISSPAGAFNPSLWQEVSIKENERRFSDILGIPNTKDYQISGVNYFKGDFITGDNPDVRIYYKAIVDILDPAGPFNPDDWQEVNFTTMITPSDFADTETGGAVLLCEAVNNAITSTATASDASSSSATVLTPDVGAAPAAYSQAYADQQTNLINDVKAKHNTLVSDVNSVVTDINELVLQHNTLVNNFNTLTIKINDLLEKSRTAKQMSST